jgi:hypothetical protein
MAGFGCYNIATGYRKYNNNIKQKKKVQAMIFVMMKKTVNEQNQRLWQTGTKSIIGWN